jgi:hypothetical protein
VTIALAFSPVRARAVIVPASDFGFRRIIRAAIYNISAVIISALVYRCIKTAIIAIIIIVCKAAVFLIWFWFLINAPNARHAAVTAAAKNC